jgi:hypothetical protein
VDAFLRMVRNWRMSMYDFNQCAACCPLMCFVPPEYFFVISCHSVWRKMVTWYQKKHFINVICIWQ